ncbi:PQQ-binding-like beta-propeller repeat protein [Thermoproteota archaeon]
MQISINKTKLTATIIMAIIIISTVTLFANVPVQAQLADEQPVSGPLPAGVIVDVATYSQAYISARPDPVGINQIFLVNLWLTPAPDANRKFLDFEMTITKPDGTKEVFKMDSYVADGTAWFEWIADQVGEWKLQWTFPGIYFPAGRYVAGEITTATSGGNNYAESVYVPPSTSAEKTITVIDDLIYSWPESPLPTDYWTRPVNTENREWYPILGDYPWYGSGGGGAMWDELYPNTNPTPNQNYAFIPWVPGPESAHIVWKRQYELGGLVGGDWGSGSDIYWSPGWTIRPTIILAGRGYQPVLRPAPDGASRQTYWQSYDIRTGEIFWERPMYPGESDPNLIEYAPNSYIVGLAGRGIVAEPRPEKPYIMSISNGYLRKYDPMNGGMIVNVSISPMTGNGGTYYKNGHVLGLQNLGNDIPEEDRYRLINWTTIGTSSNFNNRVISNTSYANNQMPNRIDWNVGAGARINGVEAGDIRVGQRIRSYNLLTGELLWDKTIDEPQYSGSANHADHGKIAVLSDKGYYQAYDLWTGNLEWQTEVLDYPWDAPGWGSYSIISAYGKLYWVAQSGIYCIDWEDGNIDWKFEIETPYAYETEYTGGDGNTVYPFHAPGLCADGKLYIYSCEHSPESPFYRGLPTLCIDAITGDLIWDLGISGAGQHTRNGMQLRIADGYLVLGARDGNMITIGKGKSATTVTAPDVAVAKGTAFTIKGNVLDMSPAQPGTPCVSKESMKLQMEYLHMQMPIAGVKGDGVITGVPVTLTAMGSDGSVIDIGTVKTNGYYGTFAHSWTPPEEGTYEIIASFAGDESYGSSAAATAVTVGPAVEPSGPIEPEPEPTPFITTEVAIIAAVVIAAVVAVVGYWVLKKRK